MSVNRLRRTATSGVFLGLVLGGLATVAHARAAGPTLTGEAFLGQNVSTTATCNSAGPSTIQFTASGFANGPYTGTFTESGTATLGPQPGPMPAPLISLHADFTIASSAGSVTGSKDLNPAVPAPEIGICMSPGGPLLITNIIAPQPALTYHAIVNATSGAFPDQGSSGLFLIDQELCLPPPLGCVPAPPPPIFNEDFQSTQISTVDPTISASGENIRATEGTPFSGPVASVTDPDPASTAAEYTATIAWGDGQTSNGTVSGPTGGPFTVSGSHVYAEEGIYTVTVTITDTDNASNTAQTTGRATVNDASLASQCAMPSAISQMYSGPTATFNDQSVTGTLNDFSASINWGDGSTSSGTIAGGPGNATYTVSGTHTYTSTGYVNVTTTVNDVGRSTTTATCSHVLVFAGAPGGGSFAIGDLENRSGASVLFWGAQWATDNPTSTGSSAPSFKGFAGSPSSPSCGATWAASPGNSSPPPPGPLPAFMAVIVTSSYAKSGPTISGNIVHIVVVQTNPGYAPDPGHPGTGTVVAQVC